MEIAKLKIMLKHNIAIRAVCYPYMNLKRAIGVKKYAQSSDSAAFAAMKDKYKGKRCFIVGNGPSLTPGDLDLIKDEYSFAVNGIFQIFPKTVWRPNFYFCKDKDSWVNNFSYFKTYGYSGTLFLDRELTPRIQGVIQINTNPCFTLKRHQYRKVLNTPFAEIPVPGIFYPVPSVIFLAMQTAIYMGFTEIYLIGQDCGSRANENHYPEGFKQNHFDPSINIAIKWMFIVFQAAKEYADAHGIQIYNATRGGALEVFERVDLDSLLKR